MARITAAVALLTALLPAMSGAQIAQPVPAGRLSVAPFVGLRIGHTVEFTERVGAPGATTSRTETLDVDGGSTVGAAVNVPLGGRLSVVGSATWSFAEEGTLTTTGDEGSGVTDISDTGTLLFTRAGLGYQFVDTEPESRVRTVAAVLSAGPVFVRADPGDLIAADPEWHWGAAIGAEAFVPLGNSGAHVYLAADDYIMFWDADKLPSRATSPIGAAGERDADSSNVLTLRAGLAYRF
ncbi:MAG: hypothetical protein ABFS34_06715 [Gemmatimonadota bacterium]